MAPPVDERLSLRYFCLCIACILHFITQRRASGTRCEFESMNFPFVFLLVCLMMADNVAYASGKKNDWEHMRRRRHRHVCPIARTTICLHFIQINNRTRIRSHARQKSNKKSNRMSLSSPPEYYSLIHSHSLPHKNQFDGGFAGITCRIFITAESCDGRPHGSYIHTGISWPN